jgi:hypothetical protein
MYNLLHLPAHFLSSFSRFPCQVCVQPQISGSYWAPFYLPPHSQSLLHFEMYNLTICYLFHLVFKLSFIQAEITLEREAPMDALPSKYTHTQR